MTVDASPDVAPALTRRGSFALWYALFGGPAAWFLGLCTAYFLVSPACSAENELPVHVVSIVTILIGAGAALTGRMLWRRSDPGWPGDGGGRVDRTRFMVAIGTLIGSLFTLVMIGQWLGAVLHGPCQPRPRLPDSPDAFVEPAGAAAAPRSALAAVIR